MPKIFLSHALGEARLPFVAHPSPPPPPLRRWDELAAAYREGLAACGEEVVQLLRPEIYQTEVARLALGVSPGDWHLVVKPIEHIRPFHGLPNVFVSDWPFPVLSGSTGGISPFFDQIRLLNRADAVACCTEETALALRAAGIPRAIHAPPFRPARTAPALPRPSAGACTILAAVEDGNPPHRHAPLLQGLAAARERYPSLRLVLAVSGTVSRAPAAIRAEMLAAADLPDIGDGVAVLSMPLSEVLGGSEEPADFFLWDGLPPGLPLPLINAVLAGLPPIMPASALGLRPDGSVPLATRAVPVTALDEPVARILPLEHQLPTADGVRDALLAAAALSETARALIGRAARDGIERRFGIEAFRAGLRRLVDTLRSEPHAGR